MQAVKPRAHKLGIAHVFFIYWLILVVWQNLSRTIALSGTDLIIKIILILMLTLFYFHRARKVSKNIFAIFLLAISLIISLWHSGDSLSGRTFITYVYPLLLAFLTLGIGNDFQINRREFSFFLNGVILVSLYMAIYSFIFYPNHFKGIFRLTAAYGNELSSFLYSSHEYGMYLSFAIVSCLLCIEEKQQEPRKKRTPYYFAIGIFGINLLLTFSRTAIFSLVIIMCIYCLFNKNTETQKWISFSIFTFVVLLILSTKIRNLVNLVLFKGLKNLGSREELYSFAIKIFNDGTLGEKLFGYGYQVRNTFEQFSGHGSVHNAYLQVILYFGLVGFLFLCTLLFSHFKMCIKLYKVSRFYSVVFICLLLSGMAIMFTNTMIVFTSPIDSFFLTVFTILVPKYVRNAMVNNSY